MKSFIKKSIAVVSAIAVAASMAVGVSLIKPVKAAGEIQLGSWKFTHQGKNTWDEPTNVGVINKVTMDSGEELNDWPLTPDYSNTASQYATGFNVGISSIGWDQDWANGQFNPWSIQAANTMNVEPGHMYTVTFKAKASRQKYAYIAFNCEIEGASIQGDGNKIDGGLVGGGEVSNNQIVSMSTVEKTYSYSFTNWVSAKNLTVQFMMGNFGAQKDYAGNDVSDVIIQTEESSWNGNVMISDFKVLDNGVNTEYKPDPTVPVYTTVAPTQAPTKADPSGGTVTPPSTPKKLAKVTGLKVKNTKKKTVKVSFKKVANATKYQIKVGNKNFTSTKTSKTIKNKVVKKGKKITVKVRATATGYTAGAWATKKVKIKK